MSRFEDPAIVVCSISGAVAGREQCPAIPYTPEEYAAEAKRAVDEGATMIHIHARTPEGVPSYEVEDFRAITEAIKGAVDDVIVNYSTGAIGVPIEKRIEYLRELRPDVAALNMGSMNYAKYSARRKDFVFKAVFENSFDTIIAFLEAMNELGIRPEHECFDSGHVANLDPLIDMGLLSEPLQIDMVMGVNGGIRPTPRNLAHMADQVPGGAREPQQLGRDRDQPRPVAAGGRRGRARRQRAGRPGGQLLPARRRDGALQRRPDRAGAAHGRGRRAPRGDASRRPASCSGDAERRADGAASERALRRQGARPVAAAAGRLLLAAARRLRGRRAQGRGHRDGRLHPLVAALPRGRRRLGQVRALPRPQPRQALDPARPEVRRRARGAAAARARARRAARVVPARG